MSIEASSLTLQVPLHQTPSLPTSTGPIVATPPASSCKAASVGEVRADRESTYLRAVSRCIPSPTGGNQDRGRRKGGWFEHDHSRRSGGRGCRTSAPSRVHR